jgi:hypothetical protein
VQSEWKVYRTRFLVKAIQLTQPITFVDISGREHRGAPGDYLVENSDGTRRLARREVFEDLYVELTNDPVPIAQTGNSGQGLWVVDPGA